MYQRKNLKLVFKDPQFEGFEVYARRLKVREMVILSALADETDPMHMLLDPDGMPGEVAKIVSSILIKWNLHTDPEPPSEPEPVPCDLNNLMDQDFGMILAIIFALIDAAVPRVAPPLPQPSTDGAPFPVDSMQMEELSPNPVPSVEPG